MKPLATCSKVKNGSPWCPKLTEKNGKWVVQQEDRAEPPETDARNGDRAEPLGLTLQPGSSNDEVRLMDMSVGDGWWSTSSRRASGAAAPALLAPARAPELMARR